MITAIATLTLKTPITRDEARHIFQSIAPRYQEVPGTISPNIF
jgi:hypothetical protein